MYQIAYIGRWETLPETAAAICDHDTPKLEASATRRSGFRCSHPAQRIHQADAIGDRGFSE